MVQKLRGAPRARRRAAVGARRGPSPSTPRERAETADRFRELDDYRAEREWRRLEGTPQRELFRTLRERFLDRHAESGPWVLDAGSGPGRFLPRVGGSTSRRVAVDISRTMLEHLALRWDATMGFATRPDRVRADLASPPFRGSTFREAVLLGNVVGFAAAKGPEIARAVGELVAPGGTLVLELVPGPGEVSRYLARLPAAATGRLLRAPVRAVLARVDREGYAEEPPRRSEEGEFRRSGVADVARWFPSGEWSVRETLAVAPALGADAERVAAARADEKSWAHLLELEEEVGHRPARWDRAAALLVALNRARNRAQD